jgi:hypothetical protein
MQPNPQVFFKSFLEFDISNLVSLLSFDSRSMKHLLKDEFGSYFDPHHPMIYKNKFLQSGKENKYYYRNAIEQSVNNNQILAAELLIDYIAKYQNNVMSSFLLNKCLSRLI